MLETLYRQILLQLEWYKQYILNNTTMLLWYSWINRLILQHFHSRDLKNISKYYAQYNDYLYVPHLSTFENHMTISFKNCIFWGGLLSKMQEAHISEISQLCSDTMHSSRAAVALQDIFEACTFLYIISVC